MRHAVIARSPRSVVQRHALPPDTRLRHAMNVAAAMLSISGLCRRYAMPSATTPTPPAGDMLPLKRRIRSMAIFTAECLPEDRE